MPDLLSDGWSDSDSSQEARDVEMNIFADDSSEAWVDEDDEMSELPSTVPTDHAQAPDRRARVEEEQEPLPSQSIPAPDPTPLPRLHTGTGGSQPLPTLPPWNFGPNTTQHGGFTPTDSHPQPPQPGRNPAPEGAQQDAQGPRFHAHAFVLGMDVAGRTVPIPTAILRQFDPAAPRPQVQTSQPGQPPNEPGENRDQPRQPGDAGHIPPFDFMIGTLGPLPPPFASPGPGQQPPSDRPGNEGGPEPGRVFPAWTEFLRAIIGGEPPEENDDPERAKKLVEGLEHVPFGLVKRMTRVDDVPGAHEDSTGTDGGQIPGCAICWDSLLPEERSEDTKLQIDLTTSVKSEDSSEGPVSEPAVSGPAPDDHTSNAIICLPCSHVFHASCLIPWFSKPRHTTCPNCRFDVDPRNLTYTPPQRRSRPTPAQPVRNPMGATANSPTNPPLAHGYEDLPPLDPPSDDEDNDERDHHQRTRTLVDLPIFAPNFLVAQPQGGPNRIPGEIQNEAPNNAHPLISGFRFGPQQPVFGPPPPPGHPIPSTGTGATAANAPRDHGDGPQPIPFPDLAHGGLGHATFRTQGLTADFTLHVPSEEGMDPERIIRVLQDQTATLLHFFVGGGRGPGTGQPTGPTPNPGGANFEPEASREWVPPPAPGPTLRQRVEAKERKAGLRCDDPSCGIGPSDEDPFPEVFNALDSPYIKRVAILGCGGDEAVCWHLFHPACLVSADRCAGWGEENRPSEEGHGEYEVVSCPVCRIVGKVQKKVWEEGAEKLLELLI